MLDLAHISNADAGYDAVATANQCDWFKSTINGVGVRVQLKLNVRMKMTYIAECTAWTNYANFHSHDQDM